MGISKRKMEEAGAYYRRHLLQEVMPFWVHAEALHALALTAVGSGSLKRFENLHQWCRDHFYDAEYGEWFNELWRDGRPKNTNKGSNWKAAYHLPRALMKTMLLFESVSQSK